MRGGGGMGAGTEYLMSNGQAFEPHALSTQGGFQFSYEFRRKHSNEPEPGGGALDALNAKQEDVYAVLGTPAARRAGSRSSSAAVTTRISTAFVHASTPS